MSDDVRRFAYIGYFRDYPYLCLTGAKIVGGCIKGGVEFSKRVEGTNTSKISGKRCVGKTSWYSILSLVLNEVSFTFLLRF